MADAGQRRVKVDEVGRDALQVSGKSLSTGENAGEDLLVQRVVGRELITVLLEAGLDLWEGALVGILSVIRYYGIEGEAR